MGRFYLIRRLYSAQRRLRSGRIAPPAGATLFPTLNSREAARALRQDSVAGPVHLPLALVDQIRDFALREPLRSTEQKGFCYHDVRGGRVSEANRVVIASVPTVEKNPQARAIAQDPALLRLVSEYLGYQPRHQIRLYWSFVTEASPQERHKAHQTVEYHFDVHSYNFAYVFFYLTDCDRYSGAHVMVKGSHRDKPLSWLFGSVRRSDQEIATYYPSERIVELEGHAGTGFIQDSSCYHKALAPESSDRLILQIRYY